MSILRLALEKSPEAVPRLLVTSGGLTAASALTDKLLDEMPLND